MLTFRDSPSVDCCALVSSAVSSECVSLREGVFGFVCLEQLFIFPKLPLLK